MSEGEVNWAERRDALRQRTFKHGRVAVKGVETMQCVIRNMSLTGARIAVQNAAALPDRFELFIGDESTHREVEVMSRSETSAGLRFLKPLGTREAGADFMSNRSSSSHRAEREAAQLGGTPADPSPRMPVEPPPLEPAPREVAIRHRRSQPSPSGGLRKLLPEKLPGALSRRLPWNA